MITTQQKETRTKLSFSFVLVKIVGSNIMMTKSNNNMTTRTNIYLWIYVEIKKQNFLLRYLSMIIRPIIFLMYKIWARPGPHHFNLYPGILRQMVVVIVVV